MIRHIAPSRLVWLSIDIPTSRLDAIAMRPALDENLPSHAIPPPESENCLASGLLSCYPSAASGCGEWIGMSKIEEKASPLATSDLMTWIAMTIVDAPAENRSDRVLRVRQSFESAISRFGLRGAEADAWLIKSISTIRDHVLEIEGEQ